MPRSDEVAGASRRAGVAIGSGRLELGLDLAEQAGMGVAYYVGTVAIARLAGKRLAGSLTAFDLIVLISVCVALQGALLRDGVGNALVFTAAVFATHKALTVLVARSDRVRRLVRGEARLLVDSGRALADAMRRENLSQADLLAGLRKAGHEGLDRVHRVYIEETGELSVIEKR